MAQDLLNDVFKLQVGRDLTTAEQNWVNGQSDKSGQLQAYINGIGVQSQNILSDAQNIYGLKNFTIDDAKKLRDNLYVAGDQRSFDTFYDRVGASLSQKKTEELLNPTVSSADQAKHNGTVNGLFQEYLGRDAKPYELDHYAKQIAQGDDPYILASALQQSPEYLDKQAATNRGKLATELQGYQEQAFQKAQPSIISSYMKAGRLNSSGVTSALAKAQQELEQQRQQYLSGISREDFVNNNAKAWDIYGQTTAPSVQRSQALTQQQYSLPFQQGAALTARGNELSDYYRQQNDFNRYLQMQKDAQSSASRYQLYGQILGGASQGAAYGLAK